MIINIDKEKEFVWLDEDLYPNDKIEEFNSRISKIAYEELPKLNINPGTIKSDTF